MCSQNCLEKIEQILRESIQSVASNPAVLNSQSATTTRNNFNLLSAASTAQINHNDNHEPTNHDVNTDDLMSSSSVTTTNDQISLSSSGNNNQCEPQLASCSSSLCALLSNASSSVQTLADQSSDASPLHQMSHLQNSMMRSVANPLLCSPSNMVSSLLTALLSNLLSKISTASSNPVEGNMTNSSNQKSLSTGTAISQSSHRRRRRRKPRNKSNRHNMIMNHAESFQNTNPIDMNPYSDYRQASPYESYYTPVVSNNYCNSSECSAIIDHSNISSNCLNHQSYNTPQYNNCNNSVVSCRPQILQRIFR